MNIKVFVNNTKEVVADYWKATCTQRLSGGAGSIYPQFSSIEELETALLNTDWVETTHPAVMEGCRVFVGNLSGEFGLVDISTLPDDAVLVADDRKNTGKVAMTIAGVRGKVVPQTYVIVGMEGDKEVVFTFHPGEPVRPSIVSVENLSHGTTVTKSEALALGFNLAKIV